MIMFWAIHYHYAENNIVASRCSDVGSFVSANWHWWQYSCTETRWDEFILGEGDKICTLPTTHHRRSGTRTIQLLGLLAACYTTGSISGQPEMLVDSHDTDKARLTRVRRIGRVEVCGNRFFVPTPSHFNDFIPIPIWNLNPIPIFSHPAIPKSLPFPHGNSKETSCCAQKVGCNKF